MMYEEFENTVLFGACTCGFADGTGPLVSINSSKKWRKTENQPESLYPCVCFPKCVIYIWLHWKRPVISECRVRGSEMNSTKIWNWQRNDRHSDLTYYEMTISGHCTLSDFALTGCFSSVWPQANQIEVKQQLCIRRAFDWFYFSTQIKQHLNFCKPLYQFGRLTSFMLFFEKCRLELFRPVESILGRFKLYKFLWFTSSWQEGEEVNSGL